jgi:hypothetical protein
MCRVRGAQEPGPEGMTASDRRGAPPESIITGCDASS